MNPFQYRFELIKSFPQELRGWSIHTVVVEVKRSFPRNAGMLGKQTFRLLRILAILATVHQNKMYMDVS